MKETDFQVDWREWDIAECNIPFGSGILEPLGYSFEESEGKKWIYLWLLLALKKSYEWRGKRISRDDLRLPIAGHFYLLKNKKPLGDLEAAKLDEYIDRIRLFNSSPNRGIILDLQFKILQSKWRGERRVPFFERTPIEKQPELIEFFSEKPWLKYGVVIDVEEVSSLRESAEKFVAGFIKKFVWEEILKEEKRLKQNRDISKGYEMENAVEDLAEEIAGEITGKMPERKLANLQDTHSIASSGYTPYLWWQESFESIWDVFSFVEGRAVLDRASFGIYIGQVMWWNDIAVGKGLGLPEVLADYIDRFPFPSSEKHSLKKLFKLKVLRLRENVEILHKEQSRSALEEFLVQCFDALVDELVKKGITRRCKLCGLPMVLTRPNKEFCTYAVEGRKCDKTHRNAVYYQRRKEELRKHYREEVRKDREVKKKYSS